MVAMAGPPGCGECVLDPHNTHVVRVGSPNSTSIWPNSERVTRIRDAVTVSSQFWVCVNRPSPLASARLIFTGPLPSGVRGKCGGLVVDRPTKPGGRLTEQTVAGTVIAAALLKCSVSFCRICPGGYRKRR